MTNPNQSAERSRGREPDASHELGLLDVSFLLTPHAEWRAAQRGISTLEISETLRFGRESFVRGARVVFLGHKERSRLPAFTGVRRSRRRARNVHVVCDLWTGEILTVYRNSRPNLREFSRRSRRTRSRPKSCSLRRRRKHRSYRRPR